MCVCVCVCVCIIRITSYIYICIDSSISTVYNVLCNDIMISANGYLKKRQEAIVIGESFIGIIQHNYSERGSPYAASVRACCVRLRLVDALPAGLLLHLFLFVVQECQEGRDGTLRRHGPR